MTREEEIIQAADECYPTWEEHNVGFYQGAKWADKHPMVDFKEIYDWLNTYTDMTFDQLDAFEKEFGSSKKFTCDDCDEIHCSRSQYVMSNCYRLEN